MTRAIPDSTESWWSFNLDPWYREFDGLGHLNAASYAMVFEEVAGIFFNNVGRTRDPDYVVASLAIEFLQEVRRTDLPLFTRVAVEEIRRSSISLIMVMTSEASPAHSIGRIRYVGWDRQHRGSRALSDAERNTLEAHLLQSEGHPLDHDQVAAAHP